MAIEACRLNKEKSAILSIATVFTSKRPGWDTGTCTKIAAA